MSVKSLTVLGVSWTPRSSNTRCGHHFRWDLTTFSTSHCAQSQNTFNITLGLTKSEHMDVHESSMTHAMVTSGMSVDPAASRLVRCNVEASGEKGYFVVSDKCFEE